jgi:hypothetical protein
MLPVYLLSAILLALLIMIVVEVSRLSAVRPRRRKVRRRHPRRLPDLEDRIRSAFDGPRAQFGEIFVSYMIWRRESETRLELFSGDRWLRLDAFTRSLVVRHLWRALEALAGGSVVIVDTPSQQWSKAIDDEFDDKGSDPWGPRPTYGASGPQFVNE